jgi:hypothetical protein
MNPHGGSNIVVTATRESILASFGSVFPFFWLKPGPQSINKGIKSIFHEYMFWMGQNYTL